MNGKYLGTRPMKITKSSWKDRDIKEVKKKVNCALICVFVCLCFVRVAWQV